MNNTDMDKIIKFVGWLFFFAIVAALLAQTFAKL
jgi:hypothetical protein